jgi:hypothetical protein
VALPNLVWQRGEKSPHFGFPAAGEQLQLQLLPEADANTCSGRDASRIK